MHEKLRWVFFLECTGELATANELVTVKFSLYVPIFFLCGNGDLCVCIYVIYDVWRCILHYIVCLMETKNSQDVTYSIASSLWCHRPSCGRVLDTGSMLVVRYYLFFQVTVNLWRFSALSCPCIDCFFEAQFTSDIHELFPVIGHLHLADIQTWECCAAAKRH